MTQNIDACPTTEDLRQYLLGWRTQDSAAAAALDDHVASCPLCNERAELLETDGLVAELRAHAGPLEPPPESMRQLIEQCKRLNGQDTAGCSANQSLPTDSLPTSIGPYQVLGVLGRGGMGVVYRGRHVVLNRMAAIKMIADPIGDPELLERFRVEAEAVARSPHPNIISLFEVGEYQGHPFVALELAEGGSLAEFLANSPQPPRDAAALVETLARAVAVAHARGVIHRDLKPANILLSRSTGGSAVGMGEASDIPTAEPPVLRAVPKVSDFGLAKLLDARSGQTSAGRVLGTPSYMAPEQASGHNLALGPACDIYALGAILYECLTGRPPFRAATPLETLAQVVDQEPTSPRLLVPSLPSDIETIVLKCLHKQPAKRYASAEALADDLRRYQDGKPILARPATWYDHVLRWTGRHPAIAALLALVVSITALAFALITMKWQEADSARLAEKTRAESEARAKHEARREQHQAQLLAVRLALRSGLAYCEQDDAARGVLWLARALSLAEKLQDDDEGLTWVIRANLTGWSRTVHSLAASYDHPTHLHAVAFGPHGETFATAAGNGNVQQWRTQTAQPIGPPLPHPNGIHSLAISPDGKWLVAACANGRAYLHALGHDTTPLILTHTKPVRAVTFSPDGLRILTGSEDGTSKLWNLSGECLRTITHEFPVYCVAFRAKDGLALIGGGGRGKFGQARLFDLEGKPVGPPMLHENNQGSVRAVAFSPDGQTIATGALDNSVRLWRANSGSSSGTIFRQQGAIRAVAFSPDGRRLVIGGGDRHVRLWDVQTGKPNGGALIHQKRVDAIAWSPDGRQLLTASSDPVARIWNVAQGPLATLTHADSIQAISVRPGVDHTELLTACRDGTANRWSISERRRMAEPLRHGVALTNASWSPDGTRFVVVERGKTAWLYEARATLKVELSHPDAITVAAWSPRGDWLATGCADGQVRLWSQKGKKLHEAKVEGPSHLLLISPDGKRMVAGGMQARPQILELSDRISVGPPVITEGFPDAAQLSPDGQSLLVSTSVGKTWLLSISDGQTLLGPHAHAERITALAFRPDGQAWLSANMAGTGRLFSCVLVDQMRPMGVPIEQGRNVTTAVFHPTGRLVVTASRDTEARLWCGSTGLPVGPPLSHAGAIDSVAFAGDLVVTGGNDGLVKVWPVPMPDSATAETETLRMEVLTGMTLDGDITRVLSHEVWQARRLRLQGLGVRAAP